MSETLAKHLICLSAHTMQSCDGHGLDSHLSPDIFSCQMNIKTSLYTSVIGIRNAYNITGSEEISF